MEYFEATGEHADDSWVGYWCSKKDIYLPWIDHEFSCNEYIVRDIIE